MLLLARKDGRVQGYVGQTTDPHARLLQHHHKPPYLLGRALQADDLNIDSVAFIPLEVVPLAHKDDFETRWTIRANANGCRTLNAFGATGNPARTRIFWARRHARNQRMLQTDHGCNAAAEDSDTAAA
jgi:hypothetical protein